MTTTHDPTTLDAAAESFRAITGVVTVDVIDYDTRLDRPALELCVGPEAGHGHYGRVPPRVVRALAEHDLGLWDLTPRDGYFIVVAV